jgi:hypothetical protein
MKITRVSLFLIASTSIFALLTASSCKKSNNSSSGSGISATISGTGFNPATTQAVYSQSNQMWDIVGLTVKTNDTAAIEIYIGSTFTVNKAYNTDSTSTSVDYFPGGVNGKDYDASYGNGWAVLTVTSLDTTGHKISGTFNGALYASSSDSVVVTNGKFSTSYTVTP